MKRLIGYILALGLALHSFGAAAEGLAPFAEVLLWQASEETSSIWSSVVTGGPGPHESTFTAAEMEFDWEAGLRTGLDFVPAGSPWDMRLAWTYLPTEQQISMPFGAQLIIPEFFSGFLSGDIFTTADINWSINFHNFDLELGHEIPLSESLTIRPSFGLKGAVIDQTIAARWSDPLFGLTATENVEHEYWGLGPAFGIGGRWSSLRFNGLRLVGSLSGALLAGEWNVRDAYVRDESLLYSGETFVTSMNDSGLGTLMLRYFCGLQWTVPGRLTTTLNLGYELQWWANQQRLPTFQQLPMHGDLTLQGGTCGVSVCY